MIKPQKYQREIVSSVEPVRQNESLFSNRARFAALYELSINTGQFLQ